MYLVESGPCAGRLPAASDIYSALLTNPDSTLDIAFGSNCYEGKLGFRRRLALLVGAVTVPALAASSTRSSSLNEKVDL